MYKISLQTLTLLTVFCLYTSTSAKVSEAQAAEKSAVSPDIVIPSVVETAPSPDTPPPAPSVPSVAPVPVQVEMQSPRSTTNVVPEVARQETSSAPAVEIQTREPAVSARTAKNTYAAPPQERVDIVLESRSSGCRYVARGSVQSDSCAPKIQTVASNYGSVRYSYESPSGFRAEIRQLSDREIRTMSLPGNGDKRMLFPLAIPAFISSTFGYRVHPVTGAVRFHQGTDLAAPEGTPVVAAFSGTVEVAGWLGGLGLAVVISHSDTHETRYGHMSQVFVSPGQKVKQGTVIGLVGSTGMSTGPHLHFELWQKFGSEWLATDPSSRLTLALEQLDRYLAQLSKSIKT